MLITGSEGTSLPVLTNPAVMMPVVMCKSGVVAQALQNINWMPDIKGALTVEVSFEYLQFWDMVNNMTPQQDTLDQHHWRLTQSGSYSSK